MNRLTEAQVAEIAHEANRVYAMQIGEEPKKAWHLVSEEQRASVIDGVKALLSGRAATPQESHENWLRFKSERGWTYGSVIDEENKKHPCCLPYDQLPVEQRRKDHLFRAIVTALTSEV